MLKAIKPNSISAERTNSFILPQLFSAPQSQRRIPHQDAAISPTQHRVDTVRSSHLRFVARRYSPSSGSPIQYCQSGHPATSRRTISRSTCQEADLGCALPNMPKQSPCSWSGGLLCDFFRHPDRECRCGKYRTRLAGWLPCTILTVQGSNFESTSQPSYTVCIQRCEDNGCKSPTLSLPYDPPPNEPLTPSTSTRAGAARAAVPTPAERPPSWQISLTV